MDVTPNTEIRKLNCGQTCKLVQFLDMNENWRKLMSEIRLDFFNLNDEKPKYSFNDMWLVNYSCFTIKFHMFVTFRNFILFLKY